MFSDEVSIDLCFIPLPQISQEIETGGGSKCGTSDADITRPPVALGATRPPFLMQGWGYFHSSASLASASWRFSLSIEWFRLSCRWVIALAQVEYAK
jgi:hypothetical protein